MMKRFYNTLSIAVAAIAMVSCNFLNVQNVGKSTIDTFFTDKSAVRMSAVGLHGLYKDWFDKYFVRYADVTADQIELDAVNADYTLNHMFNYTLRAEDNATDVMYLWSHGYEIINNATNILHYAADLPSQYPSESDQAEFKKYFGYSYFFRGLTLFQLCCLYGQNYGFTADASHLGVPVVTSLHGFDEMIPRNTVKECYDQAIADLLKARELLGEGTSDIYYASGAAAEAALARVYLYKGDWVNAEKYSKGLIDKFELTPRDKYEDMFRRAHLNKGSETIFRLSFYNDKCIMTGNVDPTKNASYRPTVEHQYMFSPDDVRRNMTIYVALPNEATAGQTYRAFSKYCAYKDINEEVQAYRCDPMVFRVSEMYLIHAEAVAEQGRLSEAAADVKALEDRACSNPVDVTFNTKEEAIEGIYKERVLELTLEGHRLFDLTRRGMDLNRSESVMSGVHQIKYPDNRFVLPICQMELQANDAMEQNPGYSTQI